MNAQRPLLTYQMTLPQHKIMSLIEGRLYLQEFARQQGEYICTSGLPGVQFWTSWGIVSRGPIPPNFVTRLDYYQVQTKPINMRTTIGISGDFYPILPQVMRIQDKRRSGFGIHWDANVPGTAGCLGFRDVQDWSNFKVRMSQLENEAHVAIPLIVMYKQLVP